MGADRMGIIIQSLMWQIEAWAEMDPDFSAVACIEIGACLRLRMRDELRVMPMFQYVESDSDLPEQFMGLPIYWVDDPVFRLTRRH